MKWLKQEVHLSQESGQQALSIQIQEVEEHRKLLLLTNRNIRALASKEKYTTNIALLKTISGIGPITAIILMTEIETIERFKNTDHFAGFVGIVPTKHDSGEVKRNGEMTFRGQARLKTIIVESAWVAARTDPALSLAYCKYLKRMEPNKAIIRIARKLLNRIYVVLKNKQEYVTGIV
jgi:transposase